MTPNDYHATSNDYYDDSYATPYDDSYDTTVLNDPNDMVLDDTQTLQPPMNNWYEQNIMDNKSGLYVEPVSVELSEFDSSSPPEQAEVKAAKQTGKLKVNQVLYKPQEEDG
ncbi:hypothetical protein FRC08_006365 [Ceratobasidium sp. 394]|nr:hypothetical protein FRC08_006365 [Ceratobasidium sp. 394]